LLDVARAIKCVAGIRNACIILDRKYASSVTLGRTRYRWKNSIEMGFENVH
jgi:hypothetical protein